MLLTIVLVGWLLISNFAWRREPRVNFVPSKLDWLDRPHHHPPSNIKPLPKGTKRQLPWVQAPSRMFEGAAISESRRKVVRNEFIRSYNAYRRYAWTKDELEPLSGQGKDTFGGWAVTIVDCLDTLWIMDLKAEFYEAATVVAGLDWASTEEKAINLFETTIRHLGGLLGAYDLSHEEALLQKAHELGEMLYHAFDTPNRLPGFWLNFAEASIGKQVAGTHDPSASPASLTLEMTRLSQLTGDPKFYDASDRVIQFLARVQNNTRLPGMWPIALNFQEEIADDTTFALGALADSLYEYLPKMHILTGGLVPIYETMYRVSAQVIINELLYRPMLPDDHRILFLGEYHDDRDPKFLSESQHLTCFAGGMFGLAARTFGLEAHGDIGDQLARGCGWAYGSFPTGVMPEIFDLIACESISGCIWDEARWLKEGDPQLAKGFIHARDPRYMLRPEAIESIFIMYRITADPRWQDLAWTMFQSIVVATRTDLANAAIEDVTNPNSPQIDSMEVRA